MSRLAPTHTFAELHPPGTAFVPVSRIDDLRKVAEFPWQTETVTGNIVSCTGDMPALVHQRTLPEAAAEFLSLCGMAVPSGLRFYSEEPDAIAQAKALVQRPLKLASIYPLLPVLRDDRTLLVSDATYDWLNSKANLLDLCPSEFVPARLVCLPHERPPAASPFGYPVVVKGAVDGANGSGVNTRICRSDSELAEAIVRFRPSEGYTAIVIERLIDFATSWCLNYAVLDDRILYFGAAEQVFSAPGQQSGSLIDNRSRPPAAAVDIGTEICGRAQAKGYRGLCGLDMCVDDSGAIYFFDLNFRLASSTCFILLFEAMAYQGVGLTANFAFSIPFAEGLSRMRPFGAKGTFVPTRFYDGSSYPDPAAPNLITGFVLGPSREAAAELVTRIEALLQ